MPCFVGFRTGRIRAMILVGKGSGYLQEDRKPPEEKTAMHDLMIALAFIGMVVAPAIVAANSSAESTEEGE